VLTGTSTALTL